MFEEHIVVDIEGIIAKHEDSKATLESIRIQYEELCEKDIGSIDYSKDRVQTSPTNDGMINALILKTETERKIDKYSREIALYETAWERLTDKQRYILTEFSLYPHREKQRAVDNICDKYEIESRQAYNLYNEAKDRFKCLIFG